MRRLATRGGGVIAGATKKAPWWLSKDCPEVTSKGFLFSVYEFPASTLFKINNTTFSAFESERLSASEDNGPRLLLPFDHVTEVCRFPAAARTKDQDIIFICGAVIRFEEEFAASNKAINYLESDEDNDIWGDICKIFLDWGLPTVEQNIHNVTTEWGMPRTELIQIYREIAEPMISYNHESLLWEDYHLGLREVLLTFRGIMANPKWKLSDEAFEAFYWKAIGIANKYRYKLKNAHFVNK